MAEEGGSASLASTIWAGANVFDPNDPHVLRLRDLVLRAKRLMEQNLWSEGFDLLKEANDFAAQLDAGRASIRYAQAICLDLLDRRVDALETIDEALALDPSSAPAWGSRSIIVDRVKELLANESAEIEDRLLAYEKLTTRGETGYPEHLRKIEVLRMAGKRSEARALAVVVEGLWPTAEVARLIRELRLEVVN